MLQVRVEGEAALRRALQRMVTGPSLQQGLVVVAHEIQARLSVYPAAPARRSIVRRDYVAQQWYERGYGARWTRKNGGIGGSKTSEMLGRRWKITPHKGAVDISNTASYAAFVHQKAKQAGVHRKNGWRTEESVVEEVMNAGLFQRAIAIAIQKELNNG